MSIENIELVPTHTVTTKDEWARSRRHAFETLANKGRGKSMIDLVDRTAISGSKIPAASEVNPRCKNIFFKVSE
jgi:hypothetical protein